MQETELKELFATIQGLVSATREGKMDWSEANKTTFVWVNPENSARIILQRTAEGTHLTNGKIIQGPAYQLQALHPQRPAEGFTLHSDEVEQLKAPMHTLFDVIQSGIARKGISFLKSILPPT